MNPQSVYVFPWIPELSDLIPKFFGLRMELDRIAEIVKVKETSGKKYKYELNINKCFIGVYFLLTI